jgi:hypothetical protein
VGSNPIVSTVCDQATSSPVRPTGPTRSGPRAKRATGSPSSLWVRRLGVALIVLVALIVIVLVRLVLVAGQRSR